jgi:hypothetical protein
LQRPRSGRKFFPPGQRLEFRAPSISLDKGGERHDGDRADKHPLRIIHLRTRYTIRPASANAPTANATRTCGHCDTPGLPQGSDTTGEALKMGFIDTLILGFRKSMSGFCVADGSSGRSITIGGSQRVSTVMRRTISTMLLATIYRLMNIISFML